MTLAHISNSRHAAATQGIMSAQRGRHHQSALSRAQPPKAPAQIAVHPPKPPAAITPIQSLARNLLAVEDAHAVYLKESRAHPFWSRENALAAGAAFGMALPLNQAPGVEALPPPNKLRLPNVPQNIIDAGDKAKLRAFFAANGAEHDAFKRLGVHESKHSDVDLIMLHGHRHDMTDAKDVLMNYEFDNSKFTESLELDADVALSLEWKLADFDKMMQLSRQVDAAFDNASVVPIAPKLADSLRDLDRAYEVMQKTLSTVANTLVADVTRIRMTMDAVNAQEAQTDVGEESPGTSGVKDTGVPQSVFPDVLDSVVDEAVEDAELARKAIADLEVFRATERGTALVRGLDVLRTATGESPTAKCQCAQSQRGAVATPCVCCDWVAYIDTERTQLKEAAAINEELVHRNYIYAALLEHACYTASELSLLGGGTRPAAPPRASLDAVRRALDDVATGGNINARLTTLNAQTTDAVTKCAAMRHSLETAQARVAAQARTLTAALPVLRQRGTKGATTLVIAQSRASDTSSTGRLERLGLELDCTS